MKVLKGITWPLIVAAIIGAVVSVIAHRIADRHFPQ